MTCTLSFEYEFSRDGYDFGWLIGRLQTPDFTGRNGMWVQWQDVVDFAAVLSRFPIEVAHPVTCDWGFSEGGQYTAITKLNVAAAGATGALVANVTLANYYEPENRCQVRFQTDYPSLTRFQHELESVMRRGTGSATLSGTKTNDR